MESNSQNKIIQREFTFDHPPHAAFHILTIPAAQSRAIAGYGIGINSPSAEMASYS